MNAAQAPLVVMKSKMLLLVLMPCLLCACTSNALLTSYESDELVSVRHNQNTSCTLLIYRDPLGQTRHVFRRYGIFEFGLTFTHEGGIMLKERGRHERPIEAIEANRVTRHINTLLQVRQQEEEPSERLSRSI